MINPEMFQSNMEKTKREVEEIKELMKINAEKVMARGERLSELIERAEAMEIRSRTFNTTAVSVRKKYYWNALKWKGITGGILVIAGAVVSTILFL